MAVRLAAFAMAVGAWLTMSCSAAGIARAERTITSQGGAGKAPENTAPAPEEGEAAAPGWQAFGLGADPDYLWRRGFDTRLPFSFVYTLEPVNRDFGMRLQPSLIGYRSVVSDWLSLRWQVQFSKLSISLLSGAAFGVDLRTAYLDIATPLGKLRTGQVPTVWNDVREAAFFDPGAGRPLSDRSGFFAPSGLGIGYEGEVGPWGPGTLRASAAGMYTEGLPLGGGEFAPNSAFPGAVGTGASLQGSVQYDSARTWWDPGWSAALLGRHGFLQDDQAGLALALHDGTLWLSLEAIASASKTIDAGGMGEARWYLGKPEKHSASFSLFVRGQAMARNVLARQVDLDKIETAFGAGFGPTRSSPGDIGVVETNIWSPQGTFMETRVELVFYGLSL